MRELITAISLLCLVACADERAVLHDLDAGGYDPAAQNAGKREPASLIPKDFTRVTFSSTGGLPWGMDGECGSTYPAMLSIDSASRSLTWDFCHSVEGSTRVARGMRTLSGPEYQAILNALSVLALSKETGCGADKPLDSLQVEAPGTSRLYLDDFYACHSVEDGQYVSDMDTSSALLYGFAGLSELPQNISSLYLAVIRQVGAPSLSDSSCNYESYELTFATRELMWEPCESQGVGSSSSRTLSTSEADSVLAAYAGLKLGADKACSALPKPVPEGRFLSVTRDGESYNFGASEASCSSYLSGATVIGMSALEKAVVALRK